MAIPGPGYSITMRIEAPTAAATAGDLTSAVGRAGGVITAFDIVESTGASMVVDISANALSTAHADQIAAMAVVVDAKDESAAAFYRHYGFIPLQTQPSRLFVPMRSIAQLLG